MRPAKRFRVVGLLVAAGEAGLGLVVLPAAPAGYLLACAAVTAALALLASRLLEPPPDSGGTGGLGVPGPRDHGPEPPPWWPEFEAQFRRHVRAQERRRRLTSVPPAA